MTETKIRWYVVQVQPGREEDAAQELGKQGFDAFAPMLLKRKEIQRARGKTILVPRPLFPGYGFVAFDAQRQQWRTINGTRGVVRLLVANGEFPIPVLGGTVEGIRARVRDDGFIHDGELEAPWKAFAGKDVRVTVGPFQDFIGLCQRADAERVRIMLEVFGQKRPVEMDWRHLEVVA